MKKLLLYFFLVTSVANAQTFNGWRYGTVCASDADAAAFLSAASITDATICSAINNMTLSLKSGGYWSRIYYLHPHVGTTLTQHGYNLKNPSSYNYSWFGTVYASTSGTTGDGTSGYGNSGFNVASNMTNNSLSFGIWSLTDGAATSIDFSAYDGDINHIIQMGLDYSGITYYDLCYNAGAGRLTVTSAGGSGFYALTRTSSTSVAGYHNGSLEVAGSGAQGTLPNGNTTLFQSNGGAFSGRTIQLDYAAQGFTGSEISALYTIFSTFQTALAR